MMLRSVLVAVLLAAPVAPAVAEPAAPELSKDDPNFVRCRKLAVTGSLVRKTRVCMTNAEWKARSVRGSDTAQEMMERNVRMSSTNGNGS